MATTVTMLYSRYKKHYADCKTVAGSYDKVNKKIDVIVPDGRMKASGTRGEHFHTYQLFAIDKNGKRIYWMYRAVSRGNALKQFLKDCEYFGYTPDNDF